MGATTAAVVDGFRRGGLCGPPRGLPQRRLVAARRRRPAPGREGRRGPVPYCAPGEPGPHQMPPAHPDRHHWTPGPQRRPPLRRPQAVADGLRAPRRRWPGTPALSAGARRPLRRGSRLLGRQRKSPVGVQNPRPRTRRSPPRRRHRLVRRTRGRTRAAPARDHAAPLAGPRSSPASQPAPTTGAPRPPTPKSKT